MLPTRILLEEGLYRVEGPARLKVVEGSFYALGRTFETKQTLIVPREVVICIKVLGKCVVEALVKGSLDVALPDEEVIDEWRSLSETIVSERGRRVLIVGEVDSGKTTFATFLLNTALRNGLGVALIDADVGQNDVGYPGTIALATPRKLVSWLGELEPAALYFVGSNTPSGLEDAVVLGVRKLVRVAEHYDMTVVNTDGWVSDRRARMYKARLVESVDPDILVVMRGTGASEYLARMFERSSIKVVRAPTPPGAKGKERGLRRMRRELAYVNLLLRSSVKRIDLRSVRFYGVCSFNGERMEGGIIETLSSLLGSEVYAESCGNTVVVAVYDSKAYRLALESREKLAKLIGRELLVINLRELRGLLVGLLDSRLQCVGVGVLEEVEPLKGYLTLKTPASLDDVRFIVPGRLRISERGVELRRGLPLV